MIVYSFTIHKMTGTDCYIENLFSAKTATVWQPK